VTINNTMKIQEISRTKTFGPEDNIEFDQRAKTLKGAKPVPGDNRFVYVIEKLQGIDRAGWGGGTDFRVYFYSKAESNKSGSPLIAWIGFRTVEISGLDNTIQVSNVVLDSRYRGQGIGVLIYTTLLQRGYVIVADESQTPQARKLWVKLNQTPGVQVNGIIEVMRGDFDLEIADEYTYIQQVRANQKKLRALNAQPLVDYSDWSDNDHVPFTFPVKSMQGGKELGAAGIKLYHSEDNDPDDILYLYARWVG
jgi:GNAT superfamily N-acetyltransferase